ncbi:MAG: RluA family pseudouridine synthase [Zetaproteobacteria bacterium]|nr:MAG: RluA family pseudouridine synthase [Zetaproteobacteria bacterium]
MNGELLDIRAEVEMDGAGLRLDQALARFCAMSRRQARKLIDVGGVYLNGKRCRQAGRTVRAGDRLRCVRLHNERLVPFSEEQLVWRMDDLLLIHKRAGQYSQEALHRAKGCLPDELSRRYGCAGRKYRPVHRLDRGTSGLLLFCSSPQRIKHLQQGWARCVDKHYLAVVHGMPTWDTRMIDLPISAARDVSGRYHVHENGRACLTEARVLRRAEGFALLVLRPITGRSHQLRVHLSAVGCPILGDVRYGGKAHARMMLHAWKLRIRPPALSQVYQWEVEPEEDWICPFA